MVHVPNVVLVGTTQAAAKVCLGSKRMRQKHKIYKVLCVNGLAGFIILSSIAWLVSISLSMILAEISLFVFLNIHVVIILAFADEIV